MKRKIVGILVMMLLIATAVLPAVGMLNVEKNKEMKLSNEQNKTSKLSSQTFTPLQLPSFILQLVNGDWDYWSNAPNLYTMPSGNVGIGTTNPNSKLEVSGIIHSSTGGFKFPDGTVQTTAASGGGGGGDNDWYPSSAGINDDIYHDGNVEIGSTSSMPLEIFGPSNNVGVIGFTKGNSWMGQMGYGDVCGSGLPGLDDAMGICSYTGTTTLGTFEKTTLIVKDTGHVGIGTISPDAPLEVSSSEIPQVKVNYVPMSGDDQNGRADIQFLINGNPWGFVGAVPCPDSDQESIGICSYHHLIQFGCPTEVFMTINEGDVGIGTEDPSYKLDVEGYVQAYGYYTGDIFFQKEGEILWRMFEDEHGLYLEDQQTKNTYRLVMQEVNEQPLQEKVDLLEDKVEDLEKRITDLEQLLTNY